MPERNPKALREAIATYTPQLLPDVDEHGKWAVAETYDISAVPAFVARWWGQFAIARDPKLDAYLTDLERRASESTDITEAKTLLEEASTIRYQVRRLQPERTRRIPPARSATIYQAGLRMHPPSYVQVSEEPLPSQMKPL